MADNTTRFATSGGDTIRSDSDVSSTDKLQSFKIATGGTGVDYGPVTSKYPAPVQSEGWEVFGDKLSGMASLLSDVVDRGDRRFKVMRRRGGGARLGGGVYDMAQTEYPSTLNLSGYWRPDYVVKPWVARASLGTSLANGDLTETFPTPASVNVTGYGGIVYACPDFNGTNQEFTTSGSGTQIGSFVTAGAGTINVLFRADTASLDNAALPQQVPQFFGIETGIASVAFGFSDAGVRAGILVSAAWVQRTVACTTGAWHFATMKWDGANLSLTVDNAAPSTIACGAADALAATYIICGPSYNNLLFYDGKILELNCSQGVHTTGVTDVMRAFFSKKYSLPELG